MFNSEDAYPRLLVSWRLYMAIIKQKKKEDFEEVETIEKI